MVKQKLEAAGVSSEIIGNVTASQMIDLSVDDAVQLKEEMPHLRDLWEETSFHLEGFQRLASCV